MAHGFLSYEEVSGDRFWQNAKLIKDAIQKLLKSKKYSQAKGELVKSSGGSVAFDGSAEGVKVTDVTQKTTEPVAKKMFSGSTPTALGAGTGTIAKQDPVAVPGGSGGGIAERPGGSFSELPGISAATGGLNAETFFTKSGGFNIENIEKEVKSGNLTGRQIREMKQGLQSASNSASSPPISPDSGVDIVAAVNRNTQMIVSLVEAVKAQTKNDSSLVEKQIQARETLMLRAAAREEEAQLEQGGDYSGFMTPENFKKKKKQEEKKETGSKLKEFFRGPNPFKKDEGCGCSPFMPGPGGRGPILGGPPGGGGLPIPDYVDPWRDMNRRRGSRLGGGASVMRRGGGTRALTRAATKIGGKGLGKAVGKGLAKKIPGVGFLAGGAFAAERAMKGDWLGAGGELLSGVASLIPGLGTAVSTGIDAGLAARDAGLTPFAKGAIITQPTAGLVGEAGNEGVFPLEGSRGKKTFRLFGEGIFQAQKDNDSDFAKLQAKGMKQYFEVEGGGKKLGESLKDFFSNLAGGIASLFGGPAAAATLPGGGGVAGDTSSLASFIGGVESGNDYTKLVGGATDAGILDKTVSQLNSEKGGQFAMGRYQIQMRTAIGALQKAGIDPSKFKFDQAGQDKLFQLLLEGRGYNEFMSGKMSKEQFAKNLSMEWAALPKDASGVSYYSGVGGNKAHRGWKETLGQLDQLKASGTPMGGPGGGSGGAAALAQAASSLKGMSSKSGPDGGRNACVWAVNKVYAKAGIPTPWGNAEYVPTAEQMMIKAGYTQVSSPQPGDLYVAPGQAHVGVVMADGKVISNSSKGAQFSWVDTVAGYNNYYGGKGKIYRMPGTVAASAGKPSGTPTPTAAAPAKPQFKITGAPQLSNVLNAANPNTGTPMMATSQQVAMASMGGGGAAPTIINNYYGGGGQSGGINPNGVSPGIGMEQTGTTIFQDLRIRALA